MILEVSWCTNLSIEGTFKVWITEKRAPCDYSPSIYIMYMYIGLSVLYHTVITAKPCTNTCLVYLKVKGCFQGVEKLTTSLYLWYLISNYSNIYCVHSNNQVFFFNLDGHTVGRLPGNRRYKSQQSSSGYHHFLYQPTAGKCTSIQPRKTVDIE